MSSFYGGPPGESFSISKIFRNKKEMIEDLNQGFFSSVKIDDFVFISYGMPGNKDGEYNKNLEIDKKSYNSTLWKKILLDKNDPFDQKNAIEIYKDQDNLIAYILLASLTGNTPQFIKPDGTPGLTFNVINADQEPKAFLDNSKPDTPALMVELPRTWTFTSEQSANLPANSSPTVELTKVDSNNQKFTFSLPEPYTFKLSEEPFLLPPGDNPYINLAPNPNNASELILTLQIPKGQKFNPVVDNSENSAPGSTPIVTIQGTNEEPQFKFILPRAQKFNTEVINKTKDAGTVPQVTISEDIDNPQFTFSLPKTQVLNTEVVTNILDPVKSPKVSLSNNINNPQFTFDLPDSAKFHFGDLLGQFVAGEYSENISDTSIYKIGDYYINKSTGFIYLITQINENVSVHFRYVACLAGTKPIVEAKSTNPYIDNKGTLNKAFVETVYTDPIEKTGIKHIFNIPLPPGVNATYNSIGSEEKGSVIKSISENKDINFNFSIPDGTRWFMGNIVNSHNLNAQITDAQKGDLYLYTVDSFTDMDRGNIYRFNGTSWEFTNSNIKGPVGDALTIIGEKEFSGPIENDTITFIGKQLDLDFPNIKDSELIAVNYISSPDNFTSSYWYFKLNNKWNRLIITGNLKNFLKNTYSTKNENNKGYSINYINKLIVSDIIETNEKEYKTYNAKTIDEKLTNAKICWGSF